MRRDFSATMALAAAALLSMPAQAQSVWAYRPTSKPRPHDQIMDITYDNFKNSIKDDDHHHLCNGVWHVGYRHQAAMAPKPRSRQQNLIG